MRRSLISLTTFLALAGCATATNMRDGKPFFETKAERPVNDVAACIARAWGQTKNFHTRTERGVDRTDIILAGSAIVRTDMVASVFDNGQVAMYRRAAAWGGLDGERAADVRRCSDLL